MRRVLVLLALSGAGCSARVQHGLDERQANEIQTILVERGFHARKVVEDGRPPTWAVEVESADAADAVRVLAELGLPRARPAGVRELLKPGLVPDPLEQHALLLEAQSGELARTLEAVDGVVSARVHLVRPQPTRAGAPAPPTKAAVYLRAQPAAVAHLQAGERRPAASGAGAAGPAGGGMRRGPAVPLRRGGRAVPRGGEAPVRSILGGEPGTDELEMLMLVLSMLDGERAASLLAGLVGELRAPARRRLARIERMRRPERHAALARAFAPRAPLPATADGIPGALGVEVRRQLAGGAPAAPRGTGAMERWARRLALELSAS